MKPTSGKRRWPDTDVDDEMFECGIYRNRSILRKMFDIGRVDIARKILIMNKSGRHHVDDETIEIASRLAKNNNFRIVNSILELLSDDHIYGKTGCYVVTKCTCEDFFNTHTATIRCTQLVDGDLVADVTWFNCRLTNE